MATHRRFVLHFNALTALVLLLPVCIAQSSRTSTDNSDTISQSSRGFGYELLRSQLDEMQASILQLQQTAERTSECAGLGNNIATILNRLETIEKGMQASGPAPSTNVQARHLDEERIQNVIENIVSTRQRVTQNRERSGSRMRNDPPLPDNRFRNRNLEVGPPPSIFDTVYDSCEDVPSSGVWKIRNGRQITNVSCIKF